jgi:hypothetical protein
MFMLSYERTREQVEWFCTTRGLKGRRRATAQLLAVMSLRPNAFTSVTLQTKMRTALKYTAHPLFHQNMQR